MSSTIIITINNLTTTSSNFDLSPDVGLDYAPRQLFSSISYQLSTILRKFYDTCIKTNDNGKNRQIDQNGLQQQHLPNCFRFRGVNSYQPLKGGYYWLPTGNKGAQGHLLLPNCQRACEEGRINCQRACEDA
jgi:hypothetical protein